MAYTDTATVKRRLGITSSNDDTLLGELIVEAKDVIDRLTGRTFEASEDTTRYLDALVDVDGAMLWLGEDLAAITSVTNGDGVVVASNEYSTMPRNDTPYFALKLLSSSGKSWTYTTDPEGAIAVVGKWAYSTTAPAIVKQAATDLVSIWYRQRENMAEAVRPILTGDGNILMPDGSPNSLKTVVATLSRIV